MFTFCTRVLRTKTQMWPRAKSLEIYSLRKTARFASYTIMGHFITATAKKWSAMVIAIFFILHNHKRPSADDTVLTWLQKKNRPTVQGPSSVVVNIHNQSKTIHTLYFFPFIS